MGKKITWKYHHLTLVYLKSWLQAIMFLRYSMWQAQLLFFTLGYFFPFRPLNSPKNENFKTKRKKALGDIIILNMCMKNHDHIQYCSWELARDKCNYSSFWAIFYSFTPLTARKKKIWKNGEKKSPGNIIILHKCT